MTMPRHMIVRVGCSELRRGIVATAYRKCRRHDKIRPARFGSCHRDWNVLPLTFRGVDMASPKKDILESHNSEGRTSEFLFPYGMPVGFHIVPRYDDIRQPIRE